MLLELLGECRFVASGGAVSFVAVAQAHALTAHNTALTPTAVLALATSTTRQQSRSDWC